MTSTSFPKVLKVTAAAFAIAGAAGLAVAQGTPPTTSSPNPATGAGQQAQGTQGTQGSTPMGTTGTPAAQGGTMSSGSAASGSTSGSGTMSTDTTTPRSSDNMRVARADRN